MKTLKVILIAVFALSFHYGYSQDAETSPLVRYSRAGVYVVPTREETISMVRESYHLAYFRHPADSVANLERFIETVDRIVPINDAKEQTIREQVLAAVRDRADTISLNYKLHNLTYRIDRHITVMGINVIDVIQDNFNEADFELLYKTMESELAWALYANNRLWLLAHEEAPERLTSLWDVPNGSLETTTLNEAFDYFGIP